MTDVIRGQAHSGIPKPTSGKSKLSGGVLASHGHGGSSARAQPPPAKPPNRMERCRDNIPTIVLQRSNPKLNQIHNREPNIDDDNCPPSRATKSAVAAAEQVADTSLNSTASPTTSDGVSPRFEAFLMTGEKMLRLNSRISNNFAKVKADELPTHTQVVDSPPSEKNCSISPEISFEATHNGGIIGEKKYISGAQRAREHIAKGQNRDRTNYATNANDNNASFTVPKSHSEDLKATSSESANHVSSPSDGRHRPAANGFTRFEKCDANSRESLSENEDSRSSCVTVDALCRFAGGDGQQKMSSITTMSSDAPSQRLKSTTDGQGDSPTSPGMAESKWSTASKSEPSTPARSSNKNPSRLTVKPGTSIDIDDGEGYAGDTPGASSGSTTLERSMPETVLRLDDSDDSMATATIIRMGSDNSDSNAEGENKRSTAARVEFSKQPKALELAERVYGDDRGTPVRSSGRSKKIGRAASGADDVGEQSGLVYRGTGEHGNAGSNRFPVVDYNTLEQDHDDMIPDEPMSPLRERLMALDANLGRCTATQKEPDPHAISRLAMRLYRLEGFDRRDVSDHLSKNNEFNAMVAREYLKQFNFSGLRIDFAMRKFLSFVALRGESSERERVIGYFSYRYHECNPGQFESDDAVHMLSCALLLLNSDLHGPNIGKRMSSRAFVENTTADSSYHYSTDLLKSLYQSIKSKPLDSSSGLNDSHSSLASRSKMFDNQFREIPDPDSQVEYKKGWVLRKCVIDPDGKRTPKGRRGWKMYFATLKGLILYLHKDENLFKKGSFHQTFSNFVRIHHAFASSATDYVKKPHVFRLQMANYGEALFRTSDPADLNSWVESINYVAACFSAPPLPAPVGSRAAFGRPVLPSTPSTLSLTDQLEEHRNRVRDTERSLLDHRTYPPGRDAPAHAKHDYAETEIFLQSELTRYQTYVDLLSAKLIDYQIIQPPSIASEYSPSPGDQRNFDFFQPTPQSNGYPHQSHNQQYASGVSPDYHSGLSARASPRGSPALSHRNSPYSRVPDSMPPDKGHQGSGIPDRARPMMSGASGLPPASGIPTPRHSVSHAEGGGGNIHSPSNASGRQSSPRAAYQFAPLASVERTPSREDPPSNVMFMEDPHHNSNPASSRHYPAAAQYQKVRLLKQEYTTQKLPSGVTVAGRVDEDESEGSNNESRDRQQSSDRLSYKAAIYNSLPPSEKEAQTASVSYESSF